MTVISVCSLKGAPGVTTLCCLLAAAWPSSTPVAVVEADPSGGDLAARFGLSSRHGWTSLRSSMRRSEGETVLGPHLQEISGGLCVLVAARGDERGGPDDPEGVAACRASSAPGTEGLVVVDLGRLRTDDPVSSSWIRRSDAALVVVAGDAAAAVQLRDRAPELRDSAGDRLGVVAVRGGYSLDDLSGFAGLPVVGELPFDRSAAAVASGGSAAGRRLERSLLWVAATRLAVTLEAQLRSGPGDHPGAPGDDGVPARSGPARRQNWKGRIGGRRERRGPADPVASDRGGASPDTMEEPADRHHSVLPQVVRP